MEAESGGVRKESGRRKVVGALPESAVFERGLGESLALTVTPKQKLHTQCFYISFLQKLSVYKNYF